MEFILIGAVNIHIIVSEALNKLNAVITPNYSPDIWSARLVKAFETLLMASGSIAPDHRSASR